MELKTIIYIVLGILYYAYKFSKNKKKKLEEQNSSEERYDETSDSKPKPVAHYEEEEPKGFEDMLEELVAKKPIPKKEIKLDTVNAPKFDNSDWNQFQQKKVANKEKIRVEKEFKRFDEFAIEEDETSEFSELFSDQDSAKRAFISSEIFNRKY